MTALVDIERECLHHGLSRFRNVTTAPGKRHYKCRKCLQENVTQWRRKHIELVKIERGGACELCGYEKCLKALHWYHRDPTEKLFSPSNFRSNVAKLRAETEKCDLICANCHIEKHG